MSLVDKLKTEELLELRARNQALKEEVAQTASLVIGVSQTNTSPPSYLLQGPPTRAERKILGSISPVPDLNSPAVDCVELVSANVSPQGYNNKLIPSGYPDACVPGYVDSETLAALHETHLIEA